MIIECKCKKYKFKIPEKEISKPGRNVQCSICNEEWYQNFETGDQKQISNSNSEVTRVDQNNNSSGKEKISLDEINPSKIGESEKNKTRSKKKKSNLLLLTIFFLAIIFLSYHLAFVFKDMVIGKYPKLKDAYGALEIVGEIVKVNFDFLKELISEKLKTL